MDIISIISKVSPVLGSAMGAPGGGIVGLLISKVLGVDMKDPELLKKKIDDDPLCLAKLKELEFQISDIQSARMEARGDTGLLKFVRPGLAIAAMMAVFIDILLIRYVVDDELVKQILIVMMVFLIWDIRQIYKFYFGNEEEVPNFLLNKLKK